MRKNYGSGLKWDTLNPVRSVDRAKSYYNKAEYMTDTETGDIVLYSYGTPVCRWNPVTRVFTQLWGGYSATTMRHINSFMALNGLPFGGKAWWDALPIDKPVKL